MDFLNYVAETSKAWDEPNPREAKRVRPSSHQRGGMYALSEDIEMKEKMTTLTRRLEELEMRDQHEKQQMSYLHPNLLASIFSHIVTLVNTVKSMPMS